MDTIISIPLIAVNVAKYLDMEDIKSARLVNSEWRSAFQHKFKASTIYLGEKDLVDFNSTHEWEIENQRFSFNLPLTEGNASIVKEICRNYSNQIKALELFVSPKRAERARFCEILGIVKDTVEELRVRFVAAEEEPCWMQLFPMMTKVKKLEFLTSKPNPEESWECCKVYPGEEWFAPYFLDCFPTLQQLGIFGFPSLQARIIGKLKKDPSKLRTLTHIELEGCSLPVLRDLVNCNLLTRLTGLRLFPNKHEQRGISMFLNIPYDEYQVAINELLEKVKSSLVSLELRLHKGFAIRPDWVRGSHIILPKMPRLRCFSLATVDKTQGFPIVVKAFDFGESRINLRKKLNVRFECEAFEFPVWKEMYPELKEVKLRWSDDCDFTRSVLCSNFPRHEGVKRVGIVRYGKRGNLEWKEEREMKWLCGKNFPNSFAKIVNK